MAVLRWWSHLSGYFGFCVYREKEERKREREKREKEERRMKKEERDNSRPNSRLTYRQQRFLSFPSRNRHFFHTTRQKDGNLN